MSNAINNVVAKYSRQADNTSFDDVFVMFETEGDFSRYTAEKTIKGYKCAVYIEIYSEGHIIGSETSVYSEEELVQYFCDTYGHDPSLAKVIASHGCK